MFASVHIHYGLTGVGELRLRPRAGQHCGLGIRARALDRFVNAVGLSDRLIPPEENALVSEAHALTRTWELHCVNSPTIRKLTNFLQLGLNGRTSALLAGTSDCELFRSEVWVAAPNVRFGVTLRWVIVRIELAHDVIGRE
jgi:hypothetical protein